MLYAHLSRADSLNDVCDGLRMHAAVLACVKAATPPSKNNLSSCNKTRNADFMEALYWRSMEFLCRTNGGFCSSKYRKGGQYRDVVDIVCLADHETGVAHAMTGSSQKEGEGDRCEMKAGQRLIENEERLDNTFNTADALHCQRDFVRGVVERGGEVLVQLKGDQKTVRDNIEPRFKDAAPLLRKPKKDTAEPTPGPSA